MRLFGRNLHVSRRKSLHCDHWVGSCTNSVCRSIVWNFLASLFEYFWLICRQRLVVFIAKFLIFSENRWIESGLGLTKFCLSLNFSLFAIIKWLLCLISFELPTFLILVVLNFFSLRNLNLKHVVETVIFSCIEFCKSLTRTLLFWQTLLRLRTRIDLILTTTVTFARHSPFVTTASSFLDSLDLAVPFRLLIYLFCRRVHLVC